MTSRHRLRQRLWALPVGVAGVVLTTLNGGYGVLEKVLLFGAAALWWGPPVLERLREGQGLRMVTDVAIGVGIFAWLLASLAATSADSTTVRIGGWVAFWLMAAFLALGALRLLIEGMRPEEDPATPR